ncbi:LacI family transcriptional regulator [Pedobacter sp. MC2016-14]|uniref:LacI family DNA-binding transcriptional regulator n=1 Tax=Pedobacter sp. MC2016-14 TaxID=2897327 RepID=UPI001E2A7D4B|nr:LacI family DNA-binding transcriptional regulator [Pedobacter sp. MC2016-14]MCD0490478.1 LacI family transcriptional regulator [Pedobacter sp. MC2016-14]
MSKKVSIKDIANQLGVSITTVSFVINGKAKEKNISPKVTQEVLNLVAELGYQPNSLAQSLRTGKTKIIGFLVDDISEPFFAGIARFIDEKASEEGYKILFSSTRGSTKKAIELLGIFKERHVDGYVIALPEGLEDEVNKFIEAKTPVVLFDRYVKSVETNYVIIDNKNSMGNATRHLIANGYKNIGLVTIHSAEQQMIDRLQGYEEAMISSKLPLCVKKLDYKVTDSPVQDIIDFLNTQTQLDAVIFSANYICMDGLRAFKKIGKRIWTDLAIVSFDDFELLEFCTPPVTAVAQPLKAIADHIMKILLNKLNTEHDGGKPEQVILPASIIIRESSLSKNMQSANN